MAWKRSGVRFPLAPPGQGRFPNLGPATWVLGWVPDSPQPREHPFDEPRFSQLAEHGGGHSTTSSATMPSVKCGRPPPVIEGRPLLDSVSRYSSGSRPTGTAQMMT